MDDRPEHELEHVSDKLITLGLHLLLEGIHLLLLSLLLSLIFFAFDWLPVLSHLHTWLHFFLALLLELVVELCSLSKLNHARQVHQPCGVDLPKDRLQQLLGQITPVLHSLGILLSPSACLLKLEVLLDLLRNVAHLLR